MHVHGGGLRRLVLGTLAALALTACPTAQPGGAGGDSDGGSGTVDMGDGGVATGTSSSTAGQSSSGGGSSAALSSSGGGSSAALSSSGGGSSAALSSSGGGSSAALSSSGGSSTGTTSSGTTASSAATVSSSMMGTASSAAAATQLTIVAPANDGTTVTTPFGLNSNVTFMATITTTPAPIAANVTWTLTAPDASVITNGGTLVNTTASFSALLAQEGNYTIKVAYADGSMPVPAATLVVPVYSNLPPVLGWLAPANDGTTVTGARRIGTSLAMQATVSDDAALLPQNVTWSHTKPGMAAITSQGTFAASSATSAQLSFLADLSNAGTHTIQVQYSDGTHTRSLTLAVDVLADLPPVTAFTQPASSMGAVSQPVGVGDTLNFVVSIQDDTTLLPQNSNFTITSPAGVATMSQGTVTANGTSGNASLSAGFNAAGLWKVAHTYSDGVNMPVTITLNVDVAMDPAPVVDITQPANDGMRFNTALRENAGVTFRGTIQDNLAIAPQNVLWTFTAVGGAVQSSQGTITGNGGMVTTSFTVADVGLAGDATIALRYTDGSGSTRTATRVLPVISASAPTATITQPGMDGSTVRVGNVVNFRASIVDDVAIVGTGLSWSLLSPGGAAQTSPGGFTPGMAVGTGTATFSAALVGAGTWTATVAYMDASGQMASASRTVVAAANALPSCTFTQPAACFGPGQYNLTVTLADPDGDFPLTAVVASNVPGDIVSPTTLTSMGGNGGMRTVQVTFVGAGPHTLTCAPTDAAGGIGAVGSLNVSIVSPPVVSIVAPAANDILASGMDMPFSAMGAVVTAAAPGVLTVTDSIQGPQTVNMSGGGTVSMPIQGFHDLVATETDACMASTSARVRYAVTPGGAGVDSLKRATMVTTNVLSTGGDDATHLFVGSDTLRKLDTATSMDTAFQPATNGSMLATTPIRDIAIGVKDGFGDRREAYATSQGVWWCANSATIQDSCVHLARQNGSNNTDPLNTNDVTAVAVAGSGLLGSFLLVGSQDGLQVFSFSGTEQRSIQQGSNQDEILGTIQDIVVVPGSSNPIVAWVATDQGAARLSFNGNNVTIQHFDSNRGGNVLPDTDVRAIAVDPGATDTVFFATAGGLGRHDGTSFMNGAGWTSYTVASAGLPSDNLQALAVDRFPNAQRAIVWVGSQDAGAFRLDANGTAALITPITTADGLPANRVNSITILSGDSLHTKWFGTSGGLWGYVGQ